MCFSEASQFPEAFLGPRGCISLEVQGHLCRISCGRVVLRVSISGSRKSPVGLEQTFSMDAKVHSQERSALNP